MSAPPAVSEPAPAETEAAPAVTEAAPTETEAAPAVTEAAPTETVAAPTETVAAPTETETASVETETGAGLKPYWVVSDSTGPVVVYRDPAAALEFVDQYSATGFSIQRYWVHSSTPDAGAGDSASVYLGLSRKPGSVAFVADSPQQWAEQQMELLKTQNTYPDPISYFERAVGHVRKCDLLRLEERELDAEGEAAISEAALKWAGVTE